MKVWPLSRAVRALLGVALAAAVWAGAAESAHTARIASAKLEVAYTLLVDYDNDDSWNDTFCKMAGDYVSSISGDVADGTGTLPLASGSQVEIHAAQTFSGHWSRSGTAAQVDASGANCDKPLEKLDCDGAVTTQTRKPLIDVIVQKGEVGIIAVSGGEFTEEGTASCGRSIQLPGTSIDDPLNSGFGTGSAELPLAKLAALPTGRWITIPAQHNRGYREPSRDCSGGDSNRHCESDLRVRQFEIRIKVLSHA